MISSLTVWCELHGYHTCGYVVSKTKANIKGPESCDISSKLPPNQAHGMS